ncbi:E3 ubiquitin-protein ligase RNF128 isoform X1 [Chiloscyllium plagiosum]|uniref:E3 ubiquitin-protein ligase RNF128 isoform X1 n=1 Tax=Chiloscyllium plagiosum TaxID=36176 RepID=UPI001CB7FBF5|nr:E3 ubiquitin-protein ligase RNF128 isoform X1 [Chiloscyllium plagiosum]
MLSLLGVSVSPRAFSLTVGQWLCLYSSVVSSFWTAYINVSFPEPSSNRTLWQKTESGVYGQDSPLESVHGLVGVPQSPRPYGCEPGVPYLRPDPSQPWVALVERGDGCTFAEKILNAAQQGASAVVIFNYPTPANEVVQMSHLGTGNMVAVMIGNIKGSEILALVREGIAVSMVIEVGKQHGPWMSQYSIFFVSVSFFVVTAATVGYFIFYSARRLRLARAQSRKQKQLKHEAKKAINQLDLRVLKHGDQETGPDADSCAVCIEAYKPNDVVRILTCNHIFHKNCIDPWLLEHRTCPMCKCDILKALGIEIDIEKAEETPAPEQSSSNPQRTGQDRHTEVPESAIYTLPAAFDAERRLDESPVTEDNHNFGEEQQLVNNDARANSLSVYVLPQDNPVYEEIDLHDEVKS